MGLERGDRDIRPLVERQPAEQSIELRLTAGPVQAEDLGLAGRDRPLPDADEMPLANQVGDGLGALALLDLGFRGSVGDIDRELDEELRGRSLLGRAPQMMLPLAGPELAPPVAPRSLRLRLMRTRRLPSRLRRTAKALLGAGCVRRRR
jgi:hypothetical protein